MRPRYLDVIMASFCALLLIANVAGTKLIALGPAWEPGGWAVLPLIFDGGAVVFPLTYILGDVLAEIYGFKVARRAIVLGFVLAAVAALVFGLVAIAPAAPGWGNQVAWQEVLGFVPRIVAASLIAYLVGQLLNARVLVALRDKAKPGSLWFRLLGSTAIGGAADTILFCTIAYALVIPWASLANYILVGYLYKLALEALLLPITLRVIAWLRRHETLGTT